MLEVNIKRTIILETFKDIGSSPSFSFIVLDFILSVGYEVYAWSHRAILIDSFLNAIFVTAIIHAAYRWAKKYNIVTALPLWHKSDLCQNVIDLPL